MAVIITKKWILFSLIVLGFVGFETSANAFCQKTMYNGLKETYSYKILGDNGGDWVALDEGDLSPGDSAPLVYNTDFDGMRLEIYKNNEFLFLANIDKNELANCDFGNKGGSSNFCLNVPRQGDFSLMSVFSNCGKTQN